MCFAKRWFGPARLPRAEGVELGERVFSEEGVKPMRDADAKPFAGLAALKEKMEKGD